MSAMFATLALIFTYVEFLIPYSVGIPGVKLGLANLVIIIALYKMDFKYAMTINLLRIALSGLLFSGVFAMLYSLCGGVISLIVMWLLRRTGRFSMVGVSMAGGVSHNFGQLIVAAFVVSNIKMFVYFPVLVFSGIGAGICIGIVAYVLNKKMPAQLFK
jgi:heptaprenyl diphosphate synthase